MKHFVGSRGIVWVGVWCLLWNPTVSAEVVDQIVAIVADDLILRSEVQEWAHQPVVKVFANLEAGGDFQPAALHYLIERQLLLREIQYLAFPKEADLLKSLAIQYLINTYYHKDAQAFAANVEAYGLQETEIVQELALYLKGLDYIRRKYRFNEDVENPASILNLFQKWLTDLQEQAKIQTFF